MSDKEERKDSMLDQTVNSNKGGLSFYSQEGSVDDDSFQKHNKSNIYDTKDYYDYYTRLQP